MSSPAPFVRPEATTWSVDDILRRAREGQLFIPAFQRSFRWGSDDVRKLFDSIYRGYPIGDLLLWETDRTEGTSTTFGAVSFEAAKGRGFVVIDGQQRITSLIGVLLGDNPTRSKFGLVFDLEKTEFLHPRTRDGMPSTWLPLPEVADTMRFLQWLQARKLPGELVTAANHLVRALRDYRVPVYVVHTPDEQQIREIFERMNTTGKRLTGPEIFTALRRGQQGTDLQALAEEVQMLGFGKPEEDWLLKAVAAVLGIDVTRSLGEALRRVAPERVHQGIMEAKRAIGRAVHFLQQDAGIPHIDLLPYRFPLVPLTKLFHLIPSPSPHARRRLATWIWRGAWSQQHARSDAPTIRAALEDVTSEEESTVARFLASTPKKIEPFRLRSHDFRAAGTKLTCAVLASQQPLNLETGEEIDVPALLDQRGSDAFLPIVHRGGEEARGTQNRVLHPPMEQSIRDAVLRAPEEVLRSHCIPEPAAAMLRAGNAKKFLELRYTSLELEVQEFLEERAAGMD